MVVDVFYYYLAISFVRIFSRLSMLLLTGVRREREGLCAINLFIILHGFNVQITEIFYCQSASASRYNSISIMWENSSHSCCWWLPQIDFSCNLSFFSATNQEVSVRGVTETFTFSRRHMRLQIILHSDKYFKTIKSFLSLCVAPVFWFEKKILM